MFKFILKGILRDKSRSLLPVIVVAIGVSITIFMTSFMSGVIGDMIVMYADFETGHVNVVTREYDLNADQMPNDCAILGVDSVMESLHKEFPDMEWVKRIRFGGLLDVPDQKGETRAQGPVVGTAIDLFSPGSKEVARMKIKESLVKGKLPQKKGEAIISNDFAQRFQVNVGDEVTVFTSTMNGSMTFPSFKVTGMVRYGVPALDKGSIIIDITDAQEALDMDNAAGEILGYFPDNAYHDDKAAKMAAGFNVRYADSKDDYAPVMKRLRDNPDMGGYLDIIDYFSFIMVAIFVFAMSIVLWNMGLLGGLRRYNEFGVRLALGEEKRRIYLSLIYESVITGIIGSVVGTVIGLALAYYLQYHGMNFGTGQLQGASMMIPSTYYTKVTPSLYYIGFIPGVISTVLGAALSGIGIYKRKTAQLFKELEV